MTAADALEAAALASAAAPDELADDPCIPAILAHKAQEREACAKLADKDAWREQTIIEANYSHLPDVVPMYRRGQEIARRIAAAIRARARAPDQDTAP